MDAILSALQQTSVAQALRVSWWAYPLVNIAHLLGLAGLFGSIVVLDLRRLGLWRAIPAGVVARPAVAVAATGLAVAVVTGGLLFSVRATEYAAMPVFWAKITFVVAGTVNAVAAHAANLARRAPGLTAATSLAAWTGAIAAGRLIGYWAS